METYNAQVTLEELMTLKELGVLLKSEFVEEYPEGLLPKQTAIANLGLNNEQLTYIIACMAIQSQEDAELIGASQRLIDELEDLFLSVNEYLDKKNHLKGEEGLKAWADFGNEVAKKLLDIGKAHASQVGSNKGKLGKGIPRPSMAKIPHDYESQYEQLRQAGKSDKDARSTLKQKWGVSWTAVNNKLKPKPA